MNIYKLIMNYLREKQTPAIRYIHITVLILVLLQILLSNFMEFSKAGEISSDFFEFYGTWLHIITGILIIPLAVIFLILELKQHGFKYFFPYVSGELSQLKTDLKQIMKFSLPEQNPYGIAATVQGLGFGALFLVLLSGLAWFISWNLNLSWSHDMKEVHETLTGLIQAFIIGHGIMGTVHIFLDAK